MGIRKFKRQTYGREYIDKTKLKREIKQDVGRMVKEKIENELYIRGENTFKLYLLITLEYLSYKRGYKKKSLEHFLEFAKSRFIAITDNTDNKEVGFSIKDLKETIEQETGLNLEDFKIEDDEVL